MKPTKWWESYPWRMVQTNLREIDMADMDAKTYVEDLEKYHATLVTLNAAGIIASYPTGLTGQKQSAYLTGDSLQEVIEECHKAGIKVIARCDFSKVDETLYEEHPDWAYRQANGQPLSYNGYVQTCINGPYQQEYLYEILEELFSRYDFDGLYCNMSSTFVVDYDLKVHEPCHCRNCTELFKEQFSMEIPDQNNPKDPAFGKYMAFIGACSKKQKKKMYDRVKAINENIAINGFDYFRTECNQDVDHLPWIYDASANARRIAGPERAKVVDDASAIYMAFRYRHSSISRGLLEIRQWQNLAYAGSTSVYLLGTLAKSKDRSGLVASVKAFDFFAKHQEILQGQESAARTLLIEKPLMGRNDPEADGWVQVLSQLHIPFDEQKIAEVSEDLLQRYDAVILADVNAMSDSQCAMLDAFVESGGRLIASGMTATANERRMPRKTFGLESLGADEIVEKKTLQSAIFLLDETNVWKQCRKSQIDCIVPGQYVVVGNAKVDAKTYLQLVPDQPFGPPEICYSKEESDIAGIYERDYGQGKTVHIPFAIGTFYYQYGYENSYIFLEDVLEHIAGVRSIAPNLTPMCEVVVTNKEKEQMIHLINLSGSFGKDNYAKALPIYDIQLHLSVPTGARVEALNGGQVKVTENKIQLDCLKVYEAIRIYEGGFL